jgi:multiple sugar transport system substrate-binding protein
MTERRTWKLGVWGVAMLVVAALMGGMARAGNCGTPSEITFLSQSHFVPAWEQEIRKQMEVWGKQKGVTTRADFVATAEFNAKLVSEAETKAGHDIVVIKWQQPTLFKDSLADLDVIATEVGKQHGGWLPIGKQAFVDGHWKAIPFYHQSFPAVYRKDLFQEIGMSREKVQNMTWDQFLEAAKKLHAKGKPVAFAISQTDDSDNTLYALLWSFGGSTVDKSGKVAINSPQTAKAIEYVKELAKYMPPEVGGWDDASNNRMILAGQGSYTFNPPSVWATAEKDVPALKGQLDHAPVPAGPAGRFRTTTPYFMATWKFKASPLAADLMRFLMQKENYRSQLEVSWGYNQPFGIEDTKLPIWRTNAALNAYEPVVEKLAPFGWPGPVEKGVAALKAGVTHIVPVMFAKAISGTPTAEAMRWAEAELKQLYR